MRSSHHQLPMRMAVLLGNCGDLIRSWTLRLRTHCRGAKAAAHLTRTLAVGDWVAKAGNESTTPPFDGEEERGVADACGKNCSRVPTLPLCCGASARLTTTTRSPSLILP